MCRSDKQLEPKLSITCLKLLVTTHSDSVFAQCLHYWLNNWHFNVPLMELGEIRNFRQNWQKWATSLYIYFHSLHTNVLKAFTGHTYYIKAYLTHLLTNNANTFLSVLPSLLTVLLPSCFLAVLHLLSIHQSTAFHTYRIWLNTFWVRFADNVFQKAPWKFTFTMDNKHARRASSQEAFVHITNLFSSLLWNVE